MEFQFDKFTQGPTPAHLQLAKKADLLKVAAHYKLEDVKPAMRKQEVLNRLVEYFIDDDIFDEEVARPLIK